MKIVKAHQTSWACPSQWDAWGDDGEQYYLRYRCGYGTVEDVVNGVLVAEFEFGVPLDGVLSLVDFARLAGLDVSKAVEVYG